MLKEIFIIFSCVLLPAFISAQSLGNEHGKVACYVLEKGTKLPIEFCSIEIKKNNQPIKYFVSDSLGRFYLNNLENGYYQLLISAINFDSTQIDLTIPLSKDSLTFYLARKTIALSNVEVILKHYPIENIPGGMKLKNLNQVKLPNGSLDLLEQAPGVTIDPNNGNIKLNGTQVMIYQDGHKISISGQDLINYLKSLPDQNISSLEILSVPPAKYDAGSASIINLISSKSRVEGLYGSISPFLSSLPSFGANGTLTLNFKKISISLIASGNKTKNEITEDRNTAYSFDTTNNSKGKTKSTNFSQLYTLNVDYSINSKNKLLFEAKFNPVSYHDYISQTQTINNYFHTSFINNNRTILATNNYSVFGIMYNKTIGKNSQLNIETSIAPFTGNQNNDFKDDYLLQFNSAPYYSKSTYNLSRSNYKFFISKVDYSINFKDKSVLQFGIKNSLTTIDNELNSDTLNKDNILSKDNIVSNNLKYNENIFAGYISYSGNFKKHIKYQVGTRIENSNIKINSISLNKQYAFNYTDFFPSANFIYNLNNNSFGFDFSRKIVRPDYNMLNPFLNKANPTYYLQGNPFLKPAYIYQFQFKYIKNWNKNNSNTISAFSSITNNLFASIVLNDTANILLETGANYLSYKSFGLQLNSQNKIKEWLTLSSNATLINVKYKSKIYQTGAFPTSTYLSANINANISINKEPLFRISGNFVTKHRYGQFIFKNTGSLYFSVNKNLIKDKLSASLTLTDILNTQNNVIIIKNPNYNTVIKSKPNTRYLYLSIKYSFGKAKKNKQINKHIEENNRINNL